MTEITRYDVGDLVVDQSGELYNIYDIDKAGSDSPDYHVESQTHIDNYDTKNASELKLREEVDGNELPHPNNYILEIAFDNIDQGFDQSFWIRVNAPEGARIQDNLGDRLVSAMERSVDPVTGDEIEFWVIGFFRENTDDIQSGGNFVGTYTQGDVNHMWEHSKRPGKVPKDLKYDLKDNGLKPRNMKRQAMEDY